MRGKKQLQICGILQIVKGAAEISLGATVLFFCLFIGALIDAFAPNNFSSFTLFVLMTFVFIVGAIFQIVSGIFCTKYSGVKEKASIVLTLEICTLCTQIIILLYIGKWLCEQAVRSLEITGSFTNKLNNIVFVVLIAAWFLSGIVLSAVAIAGSIKNRNSPDFESETQKVKQFVPQYFNQPQWYNGTPVYPCYNNNPNGFNNPYVQNNQGYQQNFYQPYGSVQGNPNFPTNSNGQYGYPQQNYFPPQNNQRR